MNSAELTQQWWQLLAVLAAEVLAVTAVLWILLRCELAPVWRRAICRAAVVCALMIFGLELSGVGRSGAAWLASIWRSKARAELTKSTTRPATAERSDMVLNPVKGNDATNSIVTATSIDDQLRDGVRGQAATLSPNPLLANPKRETNTLERTSPASSITMFAFLLIWAAGLAMVGIRALAGRLALARWRCRCIALHDGEIIEAVARWSRALRVTRRIQIIESVDLKSPVAFGIFRPTIALPLEFRNRFNPTRREAMLGHELSHLAGRDPLWCLIADSAAALLWWHPAIWWMRHQLQLAAELAADDSSLLMADGPRVLSECLVELGAQLIDRPAPGQLSAGGFRSSLGCRVERLLKIEGRSFAAMDQRKAALVTILGPVAMVAMVVVCSAWTAPGEISKGQNMNTKSKQKSLAMLALTAVLGGSENPVALAQAPQAVNPAAYGRAGAGAPPPQPGGLPSGAGNGPYQNRAGGFGGAADPFGPGMSPRAGWRGDSERGAQLDAKLRGIMLDEVTFDGLPLAEVLRFVSDESRKHDPEKKGINFLIKPNVGWPQSPAIDPTSGLPTPAAVGEPIDVGATTIKFNLPLRHISMKDLLDAIVKVADKPIEFALEDYGVVFAIRPEGVGFQPTGMMMPTPQPQPQQAAETHFAVSTFRVNTNTFAAGIENVFGIKLGNPGGKDGLRSRQVQAAMKELMAQLGISVEGGKTVFYNELTGVLMVRGTMEDLDVVRAAIETLGEPDKELPGGGVGFAPGTSPGQPNAALTEEQRKFRARYGLDVPGR